jgi:hypothetical protein
MHLLEESHDLGVSGAKSHASKHDHRRLVHVMHANPSFDALSTLAGPVHLPSLHQ